MSSRVFRKLQGDSQLDIQEDVEEDEFNIVPTKGKKKQHIVNPFDLVRNYLKLLVLVQL